MKNPRDIERKRACIELRVGTKPSYTSVTASGDFLVADGQTALMQWLNLETGKFRIDGAASHQEIHGWNMRRDNYDFAHGKQDHGKQETEGKIYYDTAILPGVPGYPDMFNSRRQQFRERMARSVPELLTQWARSMFAIDGPAVGQTNWGGREHGGIRQEEEETLRLTRFNRGSNSPRSETGPSVPSPLHCPHSNHGVSEAYCHSTTAEDNGDSFDSLSVAGMSWYAYKMPPEFQKDIAGHDTRAVAHNRSGRSAQQLYDVKHTRMHAFGMPGVQQNVNEAAFPVVRRYLIPRDKTQLPKHFEDPHVCPVLAWKVALDHLPPGVGRSGDRTGDRRGGGYADCSSYDVMKNKTCAFLHFTDTPTDASGFVNYGAGGVPPIINIAKCDKPHPFPNNTYYAVLRRANNIGRMRRISRGRYVMGGQHYKMTLNRYCYWDRNEGLLRSPLETKFLPVALGEDIANINQYVDPFFLKGTTIRNPSFNKESLEPASRSLGRTIEKLSSGKSVVLLRSIVGCNCAPRAQGMSVPNRGALNTPALTFIGNSLFRYGDLIARVLMIKGKYVVLTKDFERSGHRPPRSYSLRPTHHVITNFFESLRVNGRSLTCLPVTHNILKAAANLSGGGLLKVVDDHLNQCNLQAEETFQSHLRARLNSQKGSYHLEVSHIERICEVFNRKAFEKYRDGLRSRVRLATIIMKDKALGAARQLLNG